MIDIDLLRRAQQQYQSKITSTKSKMSQVENDYDSLVKFKRLVQTTQEEFESVNSSKSKILESVAKVKANSVVAKGYYTGLKGILSGIGVQLIPLAFQSMLNNIQKKLTSYKNKVAGYEDDIDYYKRKVRELDEQIALAQELEDANL